MGKGRQQLSEGASRGHKENEEPTFSLEKGLGIRRRELDRGGVATPESTARG